MAKSKSDKMLALMKRAASTDSGSIHVLPKEASWIVKREGARRASIIKKSKESALKEATRIAPPDAYIVVHDESGYTKIFLIEIKKRKFERELVVAKEKDIAQLMEFKTGKLTKSSIKKLIIGKSTKLAKVTTSKKISPKRKSIIISSKNKRRSHSKLVKKVQSNKSNTSK